LPPYWLRAFHAEGAEEKESAEELGLKKSLLRDLPVLPSSA
jgi:hypothetical protein